MSKQNKNSWWIVIDTYLDTGPQLVYNVWLGEYNYKE